ASSTRRASPSLLPRPSFPASSIKRRAAGRSRPTPTSFTSTKSTGAATSPPGSSRSSSPRRSAQRSAHCVSREVVVSTTVESAFEIRPFHIDVPQEELDGLRSRIEATRFVDEETVGDQSQGVQFGDDSETRALLGDGVRLAQVRGEAECPAQFVTEIDGLNIHFIHV